MFYDNRSYETQSTMGDSHNLLIDENTVFYLDVIVLSLEFFALPINCDKFLKLPFFVDFPSNFHLNKCS